MTVNKKTINLNVPLLSRVEGEGALDLTIRNNTITELKLRIFEPPRFFEKLLQGRHYSEVPDIVSRICGICPVAYQMSAVQALESLFEVDPGEWVRDMRRVFYCGEWIESHSLHIHLLAAPDFLGFDSGPEMAQKYPEEMRRGLRLQALGNRLIRLFGARSVNPVGVRVGGFYKAPAVKDVITVLQELQQAKADAAALLRWCAGIELPQPEYPDQDSRFNYVALEESQAYPMMGSTLVSAAGDRIEINEFERHFIEHQVPHSTALHCYLENKPYLVGPLARMNLFYQKLREPLKSEWNSIQVEWPSHNSFHSLLARAMEIYYAVLEATRLLQAYEVPDTPFVAVNAKAGVAYGCSEAPRGFLWHRYEVSAAGIIDSARIVPPTSQNQAQIERDIKETLESLGLDAEESILKQRAEQVIRNYDPCISCATHFLKLSVERQ